jgi:hypothetical protein
MDGDRHMQASIERMREGVRRFNSFTRAADERFGRFSESARASHQGFVERMRQHDEEARARRASRQQKEREAAEREAEEQELQEALATSDWLDAMTRIQDLATQSTPQGQDRGKRVTFQALERSLPA